MGRAMRFLFLGACISVCVRANAIALPAGPVRDFTEQVLEARARAKDVWPGFDLAGMPLLLHFPGKGTVLLNDGGRPEGFSRVGEGTSFKPGRFELTSARFDADVPFNGRSTFFFRHDSAATDRSEVELLVHESFHKFQGMPPSATDQGFFASIAPKAAGRIAYGAHIENSALFQALASPDRFLDEAKTFVALRRKHLAAMDPPVAAALLEQETREGSAEYVALRSGIKNPLDAGAAAMLLAPRLAGALTVFAELGARAPERLAPSLYGSGPAQMLILDRLRSPWKDRIARGETIFAVMQDAVGADDESGRVKRALARWGDSGLERSLRSPRKEPSDEPQAQWASFDGSTQQRVVLKIWDGKVSSSLSFSGSKQPLVGPERSSLYAGIAEASLHATPGISVTFRRTSVRSGHGHDQKRVGRMEQFPVEIEALLPDSTAGHLRVDGRPFSPGAAKRTFQRLEWTSPHIDLMISRPGSIVRTMGRVIVEIDPPRDR